jgi:hypothetical protein
LLPYQRQQTSHERERWDEAKEQLEKNVKERMNELEQTHWPPTTAVVADTVHVLLLEKEFHAWHRRVGNFVKLIICINNNSTTVEFSLLPLFVLFAAFFILSLANCLSTSSPPPVTLKMVFLSSSRSSVKALSLSLSHFIHSPTNLLSFNSTDN